MIASSNEGIVYSRLQASFNKVVVHAYRLLGFVALTAILVGLAAYFSLNGFYFVSRSWVAPVIVSPTDRRVLELNAQFAQQASLRDSLVGQRLDGIKIADADRVLAKEEEFQRRFRAALDSDIRFRRNTLQKLGALSQEYVRTGVQITRANREYAGLTREQVNNMLAAQLITRDEAVRANQQIADLESTNLGLKVKGEELGSQTASLSREVDSLSRAQEAVGELGSGGSGRSAMSQSVLAIKHEFDRSRLEAARARDAKQALEQGAASLETAIARYDALLKTIKDSPYLKAVDKNLTVAFVPYDHLQAARPGVPVYSCKANILWCKPVGRIGQVLEGEVVGHHPMQNVELRGVMVEVVLNDIQSAQSAVLHLGSAPLLF